MSLVALAFALALGGGPVEPPPAPPRPTRERSEATGDDEVIRNLELLEQLELLRKLELFDAAGDEDARPNPLPPRPVPPPRG